ncbi:acyl carrier protein [Streptomyces sp. NPDC059688]|jgi:acyl carrier protein|uniref:Acyl carrier protein n=2 Tax=Streptomyces TaxID=1883 RepID=A0ABY6EW51_9ACTN|nr:MULTISPECIES: acyl carrier protein [unclassified Streptomyces]OKJ79747.1 acyl carrier protein [Streptomyces sp. CB01883]ROP46512.1 acyl carrier protein [Streptomyces sp. PanSC9]UXY38619.1 acyl carrier protein [Streptomyces sp. HUAS 14-6]
MSTRHAYSLDDFADTVRDELGLPLTDEQIAADFDEVPEWDSLHLLKLVTAVEQATGRPVPVGRVLEARSLKEIYELAVPA